MLEVKDVSVSFGNLLAVDHVSLTVKSGGVVGLIGPNGSGKSSLLNAVCGLVPRSAGEVRVRGKAIRPDRPGDLAPAGVARTFQTPRVVPELTCLDNVRLGQPQTKLLRRAFLNRRAMVRQERELAGDALALMSRLGIADRRDDRADELSFGVRRLVELARVLVTKPAVLLLDEPAAGLNEDESEALRDFLLEQARAGLAVLAVEHKLDFLRSLCDRLVAIDVGRVIATGTPDDVLHDERVVSVYLGGASHA